MAAGASSSGWKIALGVAMIGAAASIIAAIITRGGSGGGGSATPDPTWPSTSQSPTPTNTASRSPSPTRSGSNPTDQTNIYKPGAELVYLADIEPVQSKGASYYFDPAVVDGVTYVHPVRTYHPNGRAFLAYDVGRKYSRFQATAGVRDDSDAATRKRLEVYGDGRILASFEVGLGMPQKVDVPITGVLRLELVQITLNDGFATANVVWGDAQLLM